MSQPPIPSDPSESSTGSSLTHLDFDVDSILLVTNNRLLEAESTENVPKLRTVVIELAQIIKTLTAVIQNLKEASEELQTSLTLAKSNLTLALSNTEMLEEALQRAGGGQGKDIGWRRWGDREGADLRLKRSSALASLGESSSAPPSEDDSYVDTANSRKTRHVPSDSDVSDAELISRSGSPAPIQEDASPNQTQSAVRQLSLPVAPISTENRFFKFRFGGGNASGSSFFSNALSRPVSATSAQPQASRLTSPSLPSFPSSAIDSRGHPRPNSEATMRPPIAEDLQRELAEERKKRELAEADKVAIEAELESLSSALFEEANKMVVIERRKLAEVEDELENTRAEREALKAALRVVENENISRQGKVSVMKGSPTSSLQTLQPDNRSSVIDEQALPSDAASGVSSLSHHTPDRVSQPISRGSRSLLRSKPLDEDEGVEAIEYEQSNTSKTSSRSPSILALKADGMILSAIPLSPRAAKQHESGNNQGAF